jgi:hypothetical protein
MDGAVLRQLRILPISVCGLRDRVQACLYVAGMQFLDPSDVPLPLILSARIVSTTLGECQDDGAVLLNAIAVGSWTDR